MATTLERPADELYVTPARPDARRGRVGVAAASSDRLLAVAGAASIAAGAMHVGAVVAHHDHRQAMWAFLGMATVELAWGGAALGRPRRWVPALGILTGAAAVVGWVLAVTTGVPLIDGLNTRQNIHFASDLLAAELALVVVVATVMALLIRRPLVTRPLTIACLVMVAVVAVPGTIASVNHHHGAAGEPAVAVPPHPFDPAKPVDLSGVPGVTPEEQARAENLLSATVMLLPQWADPAYDEAHGFRSIGDGFSGVEHYVNQAFIDDNTLLDPDKPESLVFDTTVKPKRLVAAMYMLKPGTPLAQAPDIGGPLTQFHIHDNLCFNAQARVAGLTQPNGTCKAPLVKGPLTPMIHVWIVPHQCGPFAALEGIGGGQILPGQTVACDHVHGSA